MIKLIKQQLWKAAQVGGDMVPVQVGGSMG